MVQLEAPWSDSSQSVDSQSSELLISQWSVNQWTQNSYDQFQSLWTYRIGVIVWIFYLLIWKNTKSYIVVYCSCIANCIGTLKSTINLLICPPSQPCLVKQNWSCVVSPPHPTVHFKAPGSLEDNTFLNWELGTNQHTVGHHRNFLWTFRTYPSCPPGWPHQVNSWSGLITRNFYQSYGFDFSVRKMSFHEMDREPIIFKFDFGVKMKGSVSNSSWFIFLPLTGPVSNFYWIVNTKGWLPVASYHLIYMSLFVCE